MSGYVKFICDNIAEIISVIHDDVTHPDKPSSKCCTCGQSPHWPDLMMIVIT